MTRLTKLHDPAKGTLTVVALMSGSGSNILKLIEHEYSLREKHGEAPYNISVIFTDNPKSNAQGIGDRFHLPVVTHDLRKYCAYQHHPYTDMNLRETFDAESVTMLHPWNPQVAVYGGYMAIATTPLVNAFVGVNVHPADLRVVRGNKRAYTGDNAVFDAIMGDETQLRSSTHIIEEKVDYGRILMVSQPVDVHLPKDCDREDTELIQRIADEHQERLKETGDWVIFPQTLEDIARGRYAQDSNGLLHYDRKPIPEGIVR